MTRGKFITLEGGEGAGKSTQARLLAASLASRGIVVEQTREPGGTPLGEKVRELILSSHPAPATEFLLFAAARAEHVAVKIAPALEAGRWVVCDRYIDSTRVYQGRLGRIPEKLIATVETGTAVIIPDLTLILDLSPETGLARAALRGEANRYDAKALAFHEALRRGFLDIAAAEPKRCVVIDALGSTDEIARRIEAAVENRLTAAKD